MMLSQGLDQARQRLSSLGIYRGLSNLSVAAPQGQELPAFPEAAFDPGPNYDVDLYQGGQTDGGSVTESRPQLAGGIGASRVSASEPAPVSLEPAAPPTANPAQAPWSANSDWQAPVQQDPYVWSTTPLWVPSSGTSSGTASASSSDSGFHVLEIPLSSSSGSSFTATNLYSDFLLDRGQFARKEEEEKRRHDEYA
jgi:hypothetical protein